MATYSTIPENYRDLLDRPTIVSFITVMDDGMPQATPVWQIYDGEYVIINTAKGRQKHLNVVANPKVAVLVIDPDDSGRWMEIRGVVAAVDEDGALDNVNALAKKYTGRDQFFDNPDDAQNQTRVQLKIKPVKVNADG